MTNQEKIQSMIDNQIQAGAAGDQNVIELLRKALNFTPLAQKQFLRCYSVEWALEGQIYGGSNCRMFPELMAEARAAGIEIANAK